MTIEEEIKLYSEQVEKCKSDMYRYSGIVSYLKQKLEEPKDKKEKDKK